MAIGVSPTMIATVAGVGEIFGTSLTPHDSEYNPFHEYPLR